MTEMPPGVHAGTDPKAAAAAAKAYAKASRPWFKKKRFIALIALAVIIVISIATGGGGGTNDDGLKSTDSSGNTSNSSDSKGDAVGSEGKPAPRGTAVQNKSAKYVINNVEVKTSLGEFSDPPSGKFVVVTLTVENVKKETIQISSSDFKLLVDGTEIETSDQGFMLDDTFSWDDLSPKLKRTGKIVFDVVPDQAGNGVLRAQAMLSSDEPIYLSLK